VLAKWYPDETIEKVRDPSGVAGILRRYFAGDLDALEEVAVEMNGTGFQKRVWQALRAVKAGRTSSYAALAKRIGTPAAVRAVGAANGANPVAVIVPCHRIIGTDGSLTGYGGGLRRKEWLLRHEGARLF
jgi:methylated-DNA-[protein]-cysteine S-methyltransferase